MIDKGKNNILMRWLRLKRRIMTFLLVLISVVVIVAVAYIIFSVKDSNIEVTDSTTVEITPSQIESIRAIGEWEFLTVNDEELVDTIDKGFFRQWFFHSRRRLANKGLKDRGKLEQGYPQ